jgi:TPR repeat protein
MAVTRSRDFGDARAGQAAKWYRAAAMQGDAGAQSNRAFMLNDGLGVAQDYSAARDLFTKALIRE